MIEEENDFNLKIIKERIKELIEEKEKKIITKKEYNEKVCKYFCEAAEESSFSSLLFLSTLLPYRLFLQFPSLNNHKIKKNKYKNINNKNNKNNKNNLEDLNKDNNNNNNNNKEENKNEDNNEDDYHDNEDDFSDDNNEEEYKDKDEEDEKEYEKEYNSDNYMDYLEENYDWYDENDSKKSSEEEKNYEEIIKKEEEEEKKSWKVIHYGSKGGSIEIMNFLILIMGFDINLLTENNENCLFIAINYGKANLNFIKYLFYRGLNFWQVNKSGENILFHLLRSKFYFTREMKKLNFWINDINDYHLDHSSDYSFDFDNNKNNNNENLNYNLNNNNKNDNFK